ncbi:MAG: aryl-sulfate sulfotransferase, partial [Flavobacteriales bacterium]
MSTGLSAQNTIGLVDFDPESMNDGYFLFYPERQRSVFLMNACGQVVHEWPDAQYYPSAGFRFLENGDIMRTGLDSASANQTFNAGGTGQLVQRKNWDNEPLWEYTCSSDTACMHHDIEVLPNGNVLIIVWELKTIEQAVEAGKDTAGYTFDTVWPDKIIEVEPTGGHGGTIVWEWHAWDHLVQSYDDAKPNFGVVADHPELIDINYPGSNVPDMYHINSVDYNPALDQIMLCTPFLNELWIIDHSTTTAEAAQHTGGNSGHGGDLLYRWGNPMTYGQGDLADRELHFNHCATWLGPDLPPNDPDVGKIMVFNNRLTVNTSSVDILIPPVDVNGVYTYTPGTPFEPADPEQRFQTSDPTEFHSIIMGGAQKLPNGNIFICSSRGGWLFQLAPDTSIAWSYINPFMGAGAAVQGTSPLGSGLVFHAFWVGPDHPGIQGHDLDPIGYIELEPNLTFCNLPTAV